MDEKKGHFKALSDPIAIFSFDFGRLTKQAVPLRRQVVSKFALKTKLKCDAIFMWWDLTFDPQGQIVLSCAPDWAKDGDIKQMVIIFASKLYTPEIKYSTPYYIRHTLKVIQKP